MSDSHSSIVRLVGPSEIPVRIAEWPQSVGIAICKANGRTLAMLPYQVNETPDALRRRLPDEAGDSLRGFAVYPAMHGIAAAHLSPAEDNRMIAELEQILRSSPRFVEEIQDFAINFEFAAEEGIGLDTLHEQNRRKEEVPAKVVDQLPIGYHAFTEAQDKCEVISGAVFRPAGAAGVDLLLVPEKSLPLRAIAEEAPVLVREDSLRVAIPLAPVMQGNQLPPMLRLPAGAVLLGQSNGKPVPAHVLRRGGYLFVMPDYSAVSQPIQVPPTEKNTALWKGVALALAAVALIAAVGVATWYFLPKSTVQSAPVAPVQGLRDTLFAPHSDN